jgi:hypothetical protein
LILRDLEPSNGGWLVSAHSKGFSEMAAEEAGETCVYPSGMIHETEIKSREKLAVRLLEGRRHVLPGGGLALLGDYANVVDACLANLVDDLSSIAVHGASIHLEVDLPL